jgi:hypothetical protein
MKLLNESSSKMPYNECILLARCINKLIADLSVECSEMGKFASEHLFDKVNVLLLVLKVVDHKPVICYYGYINEEGLDEDNPPM